MTKKQALQLQSDWGSHITPEDFSETLYLHIKDVGTQVFKQCCYHEQDNYIFIWTKNESFLVNKKDLGDFVAVVNPTDTIISKANNKKVV
jgi:hypothetical protein